MSTPSEDIRKGAGSGAQLGSQLGIPLALMHYAPEVAGMTHLPKSALLKWGMKRGLTGAALGALVGGAAGAITRPTSKAISGEYER